MDGALPLIEPSWCIGDCNLLRPDYDIAVLMSNFVCPRARVVLTDAGWMLFHTPITAVVPPLRRSERCCFCTADRRCIHGVRVRGP